jgi:hypothetical protein
LFAVVVVGKFFGIDASAGSGPRCSLAEEWKHEAATLAKVDRFGYDTRLTARAFDSRPLIEK